VSANTTPNPDQITKSNLTVPSEFDGKEKISANVSSLNISTKLGTTISIE
jgi:hypothetical protein